MGNQLAAPTKPGSELSGDLLQMVVKETLGGGRLLKTLLCLHDNGGMVVVKVFAKRKDTTSLAPYKQQLEAVRSALLGLPCPHVWPMQTWWETPSAAYMMRQHFAANLYERLSTRPFLTAVEKRWITFQLLHALSQAHAHGVCHGDIKCENILVTSWNWVLLADFASYKPTYLPADNPADFSYYFDTGGRRRCYLAPERFFEGSAAAINTAAPLTPEMDVFSLGCVIAELWLGEGRAFLDLSRLLAYRRGEYDPAPALAGVPPDVVELVMHMIQRRPGDRWSADHYLTSWPRALFPSHFAEVLQPFFASLLDLDADARLAAVAANYEALAAAVQGGSSSSSSSSGSAGEAAAAAAALLAPHAPPQTPLPAAVAGPGQHPQRPAPVAVSGTHTAAIAGIVPGAGAAAGTALLAEVDSLLAGVGGVQQRLAGLAAPSSAAPGAAAEDDGICIDEPSTRRSREGAAAAAAAAGASGGASGSTIGRPPLCLVEAAATAPPGSGSGSRQDQGMVLLAVLLCTLLRGSRLAEGKRAAMLLLCRAALLCDDTVRLQTVVPYLLTQLSEPHAAVRTLALSCVVRVMSCLSALPPADAKVYHDYLLPSLSLLPNDPEESVRVAYAQAISHLAAAAHKHLLAMQYGRGAAAPPPQQQQQEQAGDAGAGAAAGSSQDGAAAPAVPDEQQQQQQPFVVRYDAEMSAVRGAVERVVLELVTGINSTPDIKRGLLSHAHQLGMFFGRREIIDQLLPLLITCLNDQVEWRLRGSFFGAIAAVGPHTGHLDAFLLPCLEQALQDSEPAVVCDAVRCLADVCAHLPKRSLLKAARQVSVLLRHPAPAVRHSAVAFIAAVARALPPADVYTQLTVMVAGQLQQQPLMLSDEEHLAACLHPVHHSTADRDAQQAARRTARPPLQHSATEISRARPPGSGDPAAAMGGGRQHGPFGSLLTRPADAAMLQHSMSERAAASRVSPAGDPPASGGGGGAVGLSPRGQACPIPDINQDGGSLLLRPSAPVYCLDLDPAVLAGSLSSPAAAALPAARGSGSNRPAVAGVAGIGSRCGYRVDAFGGPMTAASSSDAAAAPPSPSPRQEVSACKASPEPGHFWSGGLGSGGRRGLLTGFNMQFALGPGGMVVGPSGSQSGVGLRPRPKSSHTAAIESISSRQAVLQEQYNSLAEAWARDPGSMEAGDKQQLDRLAATLHRLKLHPGNDVRCPAALLTYKIAALTSRAGPTGVPGADAASGTSVSYAVNAAMTTGIGQHLPGVHDAAGGPAWRPRGVLVSHLHEHRAAVNSLATSTNGALLFSGSDDETVKVWDVRGLERDVSFSSRLTYAGQSGRITSVCPVLDGASVASASSSGNLHVWRVEYATKPGGWAPDKYHGITAVRQVSPGEGAILHAAPWCDHPALLLYASQRGGVHCCDLRCAKDAWHVPPAASLGLVQKLVVDPSGQHWLVQGSSRGWVCLWDVRFLLCVNSWQLPQRSGIQAMAAAVAAPSRLGLAQGGLPRADVPLLYIAAGHQEVGLWDVLDGQCHQVIRVLNSDESMLNQADPPAALQQPSGGASGAAAGSLASELNAHMAIDQINTPQARMGGVTALLPLGGGALLTGGADRCVRFWEPSWPERSYIVAGPVWPDNTAIIDSATNKLQVPGHSYRYHRVSYRGVPVVEERSVGEGPHLVTPDSSPDLGSKLRMHDLAHVDGITQLIPMETSSRLLATASRDGCVKVWS